jgi:hypothetical protein
MKINKSIILASLLLLPIAGNSASQPCSGKKDGIAHCDGAKLGYGKDSFVNE